MSTGITITELWLYPIKSCRGISVQRATVGPRGIVHDRGWMVVQPDGMFLTQREHPRLATITPVFEQNHLRIAAPGVEPVSVPLTADGAGMDVVVWRDRCAAIDQGDAAARWFGEVLQTECRLVRMADDWVRPVDPVYARPDDRVGFADAYPLLLASESSLAELNRRMDRALPMNRFRPNVVVQGAEPFAEDSWRRIRAGDMTLRVAKPCARCVTTTVDQGRGVKDGQEPLVTLAQFRKKDGKVLFAQNLIHDAEGVLDVGAEIEIMTTNDQRRTTNDG